MTTIVKILLLSSIIVGMTQSMMETKKEIVYEAAGIKYKKNNFGDIMPQWQEIPHKLLTQQLSSFINELKEKEKMVPFIIEVPHEKASALDSIKKAGFTLRYANNNKTEWIFKNNSQLPEPYTTFIGAQILIRKNDDVLVIEEKTRIGMPGFPGGQTEFQELTRAAAVRELKEELNLDVNPNDLKLLAILNRTKANGYKATNIIYYYVVDHNKTSGNLQPNPNEILRAFYAPLKDFVEEKSINGLKAKYPTYSLMAKHLLDKNAISHHETLLDYRQLSKDPSDRNANDTMDMEFFACNTI